MKIHIREMDIDTEGETDLNLTQVKLAQLFRAWMAPPASPAPQLVKPEPAPAVVQASAPSEAVTSAPDGHDDDQPTLEPEAPSPTRLKAVRSMSMPTDLCRCGAVKLQQSKYCRRCAAKAAAQSRKQRVGSNGELVSSAER